MCEQTYVRLQFVWDCLSFRHQRGGYSIISHLFPPDTVSTCYIGVCVCTSESLGTVHTVVVVQFMQCIRSMVEVMGVVGCRTI